MRAPRARARSSDSRIIAPAPSPMTKTSRSRSNAREARAGSALERVDRARSELNPAKARGVRLASDPTAMTASAWPDRMHMTACPIAWAPDEQAVEIVRLGPLAPWATAIRPDVEFRV